MERIESLHDALHYLNAGFTLISADDVPVRHRQLGRNIQVHSEQYTVLLSLQEWKDLYGEKVFWLYDDSDEETVDLERDREYYSWKHK